MKALGVDLGTTSIAAVVYDTAASRVVWCESRPHGAQLSTDDPLASMQDAECMLALAERMVEKGLSEHPDVAAIGVTGQMHGVVYLDAHLAPVSPLFTWQDRRAGQEASRGETFAERLSRLTRCPVHIGYGLATHGYLAHHGLVPQGALWIATLPDAFAARLAGLSRPRAHASLAHSMGGFDLEQETFAAEGLQAAGMDLSFLPELAPDLHILGEHRGIPVAVALGDHQASFLGAVGVEERGVLVNIGTGAQVSVCVRGRPDLPPGAELRPFLGNLRLAVAATLAGGAAYALVAAFFDRVVRMHGLAPTRSTYDVLDEAIAAWRQSGGGPFPRVHPTFFGSRLSDEDGARVERWTAAAMVPEAFALGVISGVAEELYEGFCRLPPSAPDGPRALAGAGNALRVNRHLRDAVEAVFGCPLRLAPHPEEAAQGAARWAAMAVTA
ncbi:sugar kinase [Alicyclobacillus mali]|uniref:Sugar kinase n=1 Tax=Alicyclobacillus mali (ex Roth et al. 2021) TaxID=1123961 RepID=A0ABS0F5N3_9BACL|nr:FGGY family carbohydrate kinase [Alicyclobacillus mali (ex Roth et al. 2021)]MBF8378556.1 sugar kinase [Alicyclobacillus mali (ex Roth et al. 2021)]MCL6487933.1 sugar kinase [Alicyclobacillus mali (ex Roth et al. 2021)]